MPRNARARNAITDIGIAINNIEEVIGGKPWDEIDALSGFDLDQIAGDLLDIANKLDDMFVEASK